MPSIDFDDLLAQADRLRDSARVDEAINAYKEIAGLATDNHELFFKARALHLAGVSAKEAVLSKDSSYYRDALAFFTAAEQGYRSLGDQVRLGSLYRDIAIVADYANDFQVAINYFQKAIEILESTEAYGELAVTYDKLGVHYYKQNLVAEAEPFNDKALKLFKQEPTAGFYRATTLFDGARIKFRIGNFERSLELAEESLGWFRADHPETNYTRRLTQIIGLLSAAENELGNQSKAQRYYRQYQDLLKGFNPLAARVIEKDLQELAR